MAATNLDTDKLKINLLSIDQYNDVASKSNTELYVVNETLDTDDPANIISSKTYADKGREAVVTQITEPTSQYTQIWIDPNEDVVYITPASSDLDNITETGSENLLKAISPDFSRSTSFSQAANSTFTIPVTGWLYVRTDGSSMVRLRKDTVDGILLVEHLNGGSSHLLLEKNTVVYVASRSGTVELIFYPCKGLVA